MNSTEIEQIEDFVLNHREFVDALAIAFGKGYAAFISELDRYGVIDRMSDEDEKATPLPSEQSPSRSHRKAKARVQK